MAVKICPDCGGKVSETRMDCPHCGYCFTKTAEKIQCPECEEWVIKNEKGECPECGYRFGEEASTAFPELIDGVPDLGLDDASIEAAMNQGNNLLKMEPIPGMMKHKVTGCVNEYVTEIVIPDVVHVIGNRAFKGLQYLKKVTISDSVRIIDDEAFADCPNLEIVIPKNVICGKDVIRGTKTDNDRIAREKAEAERIVKEEAERKAKKEAERIAKEKAKQELKATFDFKETADGTEITSFKQKNAECIVIPDFVTSIGMGAFYNCNSLTSVTIPDSVTSVDEGAFIDCCNLTSITVNAGNKKYHIAGNCLIETASKMLIAVCKNSVIPTDGSVTSIGNLAFGGCNNLTSITIPDSVTSIGDQAFMGCNNLAFITIPDGVTCIGAQTFTGCINLTSITISDSVTSIGLNAFCDCRSLTSIRYTGTKSQWEKILKDKLWDNGCGYYAIHCSDGDI